MRILVLLTDGFGVSGGIAKFNSDLLHALCSHPQVSEVVVIPRVISDIVGTLPAKLSYQAKAAGGKLKFVQAIALSTFGRKTHFDLVICGHLNLLPFAAAARALLRASPTLLLVVHGIDAWQPTDRSLTNRCVRKVDHCISVSEFTQKRFSAWSGFPKEKCSILPNSIDVSLYGVGEPKSELLERYNLHGKKILFTLARLSAEERYKGIDEILEVLPKLLHRIPKLAYLIGGDGSDRPRLEQKASDLGLKGCVTFTGGISESEKADHFRLVDGFAMPSRGEGFGIVYLEALACGIPVLASNLDAGQEALRQGKLGLLVDPNKSLDLERGLLDLLNSPKGTIPAGLDDFSYHRFCERINILINRVSSESMSGTFSAKHTIYREIMLKITRLIS